MKCINPRIIWRRQYAVPLYLTFIAFIYNNKFHRQISNYLFVTITTSFVWTVISCMRRIVIVSPRTLLGRCTLWSTLQFHVFFIPRNGHSRQQGIKNTRMVSKVAVAIMRSETIVAIMNSNNDRFTRDGGSTRVSSPVGNTRGANHLRLGISDGACRCSAPG